MMETQSQGAGYFANFDLTRVPRLVLWLMKSSWQKICNCLRILKPVQMSKFLPHSKLFHFGI